MKRDSLKLYAVTEAGISADILLQKVRAAAEGGATFLQLREKGLDTLSLTLLAKRVKKIADEFHIPFVVNDDITAAVNSGADGVHVGQADEDAKVARARIGAGKILGVSVQTVAEAIKAEKNGADYLGVGAVFPTSSKADAEFVSQKTLREICEAVKIPVVAIGGITRENLSKLYGSGISGIAVISALFGAEDITAASRELYADVLEMLKEVEK